MDTTAARLIQYNVVVVFQQLKFGQVLYELARQLLPGYSTPLITEVPNQLLVVIYPDRKLKCQFANRRVDVTDGRGLEPGYEPFAQVVIRAVEAAQQAAGPEIPIVAYGYNYDIVLTLGLDVGQFLQTRFFSDPTVLGRVLGGTVESVGIKASVKTSGSLVNFDIEPAPGESRLVKVHINYHFQGKTPPSSAEALTKEIVEKYAEFKGAIARL